MELQSSPASTVLMSKPPGTPLWPECPLPAEHPWEKTALASLSGVLASELGQLCSPPQRAPPPLSLPCLPSLTPHVWGLRSPCLSKGQVHDHSYPNSSDTGLGRSDFETPPGVWSPGICVWHSGLLRTAPTPQSRQPPVLLALTPPRRSCLPSLTPLQNGRQSFEEEVYCERDSGDWSGSWGEGRGQ